MNKESLNIESLEINVLKASEIKDGDILIVKMGKEQKSKMNKEDVKNIYDQVVKMIKRSDISIYFFPEDLSIDIIRNNVKMFEDSKIKIEQETEQQINENNS
jgi:CRISPR/Cas system-associated endoribonuclease Cas2